jgi:hypothetical protein
VSDPSHLHDSTRAYPRPNAAHDVQFLDLYNKVTEWLSLAQQSIALLALFKR